MTTFTGFEVPVENWFKCPVRFIELLPKIETKGELMAILYVLRHTWGYQEFGDFEAKAITLDEFEHGRKRRDGTRIDNGTGLNDKTIMEGLNRAVEHRFLIRFVDNTHVGRSRHYYRMRMEGDPEPDTIYAIDPVTKEVPWANVPDSVKKMVYQRYGGLCAYCRKPSDRWHFDHIWPRSRGGPDTFDNLALACPRCNLIKHDRSPDEWGHQPVYQDETGSLVEYVGWRDYIDGPAEDLLEDRRKISFSPAGEITPRSEKDTERQETNSASESLPAFSSAENVNTNSHSPALEPQVVQVPMGGRAAERDAYSERCDQCLADLTQDRDACPDCGRPVEWRNSRLAAARARKRKRQGIDARARALREGESFLSPMTGYVLALARATAVTGACRYAGGQEKALWQYEQAYGPEIIREKVDEFKAAGDRGQGLIKHLLNWLGSYNPVAGSGKKGSSHWQADLMRRDL